MYRLYVIEKSPLVVLENKTNWKAESRTAEKGKFNAQYFD